MFSNTTRASVLFLVRKCHRVTFFSQNYSTKHDLFVTILKVFYANCLKINICTSNSMNLGLNSERKRLYFPITYKVYTVYAIAVSLLNKLF